MAGVFGAGKTRSLTFLLAWLALTTQLKIAVVRKENRAGRAITKLLTTFDLQPSHQQYFIRPVGRVFFARVRALCVPRGTSHLD